MREWTATKAHASNRSKTQVFYNSTKFPMTLTIEFGGLT